MAISREQKEQQVTKLAEDFANAKMTVLADYKGLSVSQVQELRKSLQESGSSMRVVKNTLVRIAAKNHTPFKNVDSAVFDGSIALVFGFEDEVAPAQAVANFAKKNQLPQLVGAINAAGEYLTAEQTQQLATLPSKQQLLGQVVGTIAAPLSGFVRVLGGNLQGIVQVMSQIRDQKSNA